MLQAPTPALPLKGEGEEGYEKLKGTIYPIPSSL
jgi:hypothetical protein